MVLPETVTFLLDNDATDVPPSVFGDGDQRPWAALREALHTYVLLKLETRPKDFGLPQHYVHGMHYISGDLICLEKPSPATTVGFPQYLRDILFETFIEDTVLDINSLLGTYAGLEHVVEQMGKTNPTRSLRLIIVTTRSRDVPIFDAKETLSKYAGLLSHPLFALDVLYIHEAPRVRTVDNRQANQVLRIWDMFTNLVRDRGYLLGLCPERVGKTAAPHVLHSHMLKLLKHPELRPEIEPLVFDDSMLESPSPHAGNETAGPADPYAFRDDEENGSFEGRIALASVTTRATRKPVSYAPQLNYYEGSDSEDDDIKEPKTKHPRRRKAGVSGSGKGPKASASVANVADKGTWANVAAKGPASNSPKPSASFASQDTPEQRRLREKLGQPNGNAPK